jgi:Fe2+ or Zn2+ uptake regulation protein
LKGKKHNHSTGPAETELAEKLRSAGLKATPRRIEILKVLSRGCGPLSVEELHAKLRKHDCDPVTLYRALSSFQKVRLVRRCDLGEGPVRYEYHDHQGEHHHHVVCTECRELRSVDFCLVESFESLLRRQGYSNVTHSLEFFGICGKCNKQPAKSEHRGHSR